MLSVHLLSEKSVSVPFLSTVNTIGGVVIVVCLLLFLLLLFSWLLLLLLMLMMLMLLLLVCWCQSTYSLELVEE